jgi:hypothetical protein
MLAQVQLRRRLAFQYRHPQQAAETFQPAVESNLEQDYLIHSTLSWDLPLVWQAGLQALPKTRRVL